MLVRMWGKGDPCTLLVGINWCSQFKLKKVGETSRPFRCELNQIPYDYTVEVTNRFKGLDLMERVPKELWMDHPQEKEMQKSKMAV